MTFVKPSTSCFYTDHKYTLKRRLVSKEFKLSDKFQSITVKYFPKGWSIVSAFPQLLMQVNNSFLDHK